MITRWLLRFLLLVALAVGMVWAAEYGWGPVVITKENEYKVIVGLFPPHDVITEPGWHPTIWRVPFVDEVHVFDSRLHYLNARPVRILIANNEKLIVDYFVIWRITEPLVFLENFPAGVPAAESRIQEVVKSLVGSRMGGLDLSQLLQRAEVISRLDQDSSERLAGTGVEVVDVRLNRTELPPNAVPAAFAQMREQRRALARENRAQGERRAREIRAEAQRLAAESIAKAHAEAERLRGAGDAESTRIFAGAHAKDPEFYAFVRSLEAYRKSLKQGTTLVVSPDHEFFRYLEPSRVLERTPAVSSPPPDRGDDSTEVWRDESD